MWVAGEQYTSEFQGAALKKNGAPRAKFGFTSEVYFDPVAMTFERHSNVWTTYGGQ
jgi:hypothetical protein